MNMDKPIRWVAVFGMLLFFGLMAQVNYVQGSEAESLRTDPHNARQYQDLFNSPRGEISAGGEVLVTSPSTGKDSPKFGRAYKDGPIFAPITGFFGGSGTATQVERAYNSLLGGKDKRIANQHWFDTFIGKKPEGANLELTIDPQAQRTAYAQLKAQTAPGRRGGAVVIDAKTGAIRVAASWPSYDPNEVAPQTGDKGVKRLGELQKGSGVLRPLNDNALSQTFPPGSTFKTVTATEAMRKLGINDQTTVNTSPLKLPESGINLPNDSDSGACGSSAPLKGAYAESCNTSFGRLALQLGIERLSQGAADYGFGKHVTIEPYMPAAESDVPINFMGADGKQQHTGQDATARSGIGQENVRATPLQMAMVASAVVNHGKLMNPYVVDDVRAKDQSELYKASPKQYGEPLSGDQASQLQDMMRAVVAQGTAKNLQGMNIAGKTGTAEQDGNPNARWFVGFAPADNPRYGFAVMTEGSGFGATGAGPIAAAIMRQVLKK
ncbi:peptidoglycan D,D-transpeptidase FtsI family protein [Actinomadura violacea]|uniref:Penicillin-binding protein 2 n=1 Tax=Actinomadura violacea TaxID=2819934 RepID=A0ABS3RWT3_9ACTN|nr:penicillin-binding transpeptidase domain-containing protein [Actinomadura violacea]MBO2461224.1 penicillin-binding protein 2 [Actinomadura violacea]